MRRAAIGVLLDAASTASFAADVGVSISVAQPGMYGRIDIGGMPAPPLVYAQLMVVSPRTGARGAATDVPARSAGSCETLVQTLR